MDVPETLRHALQDRYAIERELGQGGMATVYLAEDLKHHRKVALKVMRPELAATLGAERFLREIETTAQLTHPHILPIHDSGVADGTLFYVMPFVEGESLRDRLERERQLPLEEALQIAREVADALGYAHSHGVIHRDIKPENILLQAGHAVVADFGIARAVSAAGGTRLTETGLAVGTPVYMSPEQAMGEAGLDGRSDLYSLGCVLYEMLSGETPYTGPTPQAIFAKKLSEPLPRISVVREAVLPGLEAALNKSLARTPADRWATASDFRDALAADAGGAVSGARPVARRTRARWLGVGAAALLVVAVGMWAAIRHRVPAGASDPKAIPLDRTAIAVLPFHVVGADSAGQVRTLAGSMGDLFELKVTGEFGRRIRHPGSVAQRWSAAGGTLDSALSEEAELALARAVGAGRLVRGTIVAMGNSLTLSATMVDVATGAVRVTPVSVEGTVAQRWELVDRLIIQLLARDAGISPADAPRLTQYKPEAIQAFLHAYSRTATFSKEENAAYHAALAADSNLVDAALMAYAVGEQDTAMLRYAWEHQDKLTERGRASLQVYAAGRYGSVRTMAGVIAAWETLTRRWPESNGPWGELGEKLWRWGAAASVPDSRRRARAAFERIDPPQRWYRWEVTELAFLDGDTAWIRAAIDTQAIRKNRLGGVPAYRWRLAILKGDTAEAARMLSHLPEPWWVLKFAIADGRGVVQADRVVASGYHGYDWWWGWARGRERTWWEGWRQWESQEGGHAPVYQALLLGPSQDRRVEELVRGLERIAAGRAVPPASADDQAMARCWIALWRLRHGDPAEARATKRYLESDPGRRQRFAGWHRLFDVLLTEADGGDVRAALLRMDSVVREVPLPDGHLRWLPMPIEVQNLMLAQMLRRYGEPALALAAVRRRHYGEPAGEYVALPEYLREEGRLAAITGDTAGAIRAYQHYLALRENPDPPWRPPWDSVRAELAALVRR